jgi:TPR repeat protein
MLKIIFSSFIISILFAGCFFSSPKKFEEQSQIKEANTCSKFDKLDKKLECYSKIVDKNSVAQLRLGIYNAGKNEFEKALVLFEKAKENGNFYANLPLGYLYFKGDGVEKDLEKSFDYLSETSDIDPNSSYQLSRFYFQGIVVEKDIEQGIKLITDAANKGMKVAQAKLATIYKQGSFGVTKNEKEALSWFNKAKENKNDTTFDIYKL